MGLRRRSIALALVGAVVLLIAAAPVVAEPWPVRSLPIFTRTAVGLTKTGPFTETTKEVGFGASVTWRFATDPILGVTAVRQYHRLPQRIVSIAAVCEHGLRA